MSIRSRIAFAPSDDIPAGQPATDGEPVDPQDRTPPPEDDDLEVEDEGGIDPDSDLDEPEPIAAQPGTPPPKPPTRGQRDFQRLTNENRRQKQQLDQLTQQVQQLLGTRQPSQAEIAEANRREQEQLEMMTPVQIAQYYEQKTQRNVQELVRQAVAPIYDQNDRAEYERELERNPRLREFSDTVEDYKRQAPGVPRRMLLATALGMKALDNQGRVAGRAARNASARAEQHRTTPTQPRGDTQAQRGRRGDDLEERLRGQLI